MLSVFLRHHCYGRVFIVFAMIALNHFRTSFGTSFFHACEKNVFLSFVLRSKRFKPFCGKVYFACVSYLRCSALYQVTIFCRQSENISGQRFSKCFKAIFEIAISNALTGIVLIHCAQNYFFMIAVPSFKHIAPSFVFPWL